MVHEYRFAKRTSNVLLHSQGICGFEQLIANWMFPNNSWGKIWRAFNTNAMMDLLMVLILVITYCIKMSHCTQLRSTTFLVCRLKLRKKKGKSKQKCLNYWSYLQLLYSNFWNRRGGAAANSGWGLLTRHPDEVFRKQVSAGWAMWPGPWQTPRWPRRKEQQG